MRVRRRNLFESQVAAPGSSTLLLLVLTALDGPIGTVQFDLEYDTSAMNVISTLGDSSHNSAKACTMWISRRK